MAMSTFSLTKWNQLLPKLSIPIFLGPMAGAAQGALAGQVSRAGGLGFIGAGYMSAQQISEELQAGQTILKDSKNAIGVGLLGWKLTAYDKKTETTLSESAAYEQEHPEATKRIDTALQGGAKAIWLGFGSPREVVFWSRAIRARSKSLQLPQDGLVLFVSAGSETEAKAAIENTDADVIVAQGIEAGGHGLGVSPPLSALLTTVHALLEDLPSNRTRPLLIAGGGLSDGRSLASLLSSGADGGVFGTRFLLTPESTYSETRKKVLEGACGKPASEITKRSMAFDEARNTLGWPAQVDGRGIVNETVKDYESGQEGMEERQRRYRKAEEEDDPERLIVWAGTGIERMDPKMSRLPAYDTVQQIWSEAEIAMQGSSAGNRGLAGVVVQAGN